MSIEGQNTGLSSRRKTGCRQFVDDGGIAAGIPVNLSALARLQFSEGLSGEAPFGDLRDRSGRLGGGGQTAVHFGSYAYGQPTADSDVDLLVVWETDLPPRERVQVVSKLLYPRPFPLNILVRTPHELEEELPGNFFLREIVQKGRLLYAR